MANENNAQDACQQQAVDVEEDVERVALENLVRKQVKSQVRACDYADTDEHLALVHGFVFHPDLLYFSFVNALSESI